MSDAGTTLLTGATGNTGSGVAGSLLESGHAVRALVRAPDKASALQEAGAELVVGDLDDPATLTAELLDGVRSVYFCTWNGPTALRHWTNFRELVIRSGGEPHIVRLSAFGTPESRIISELQKAEEDLKASGLPWTLLQPTFFMQNVMMTAPTVKEQGTIYWDWGVGRAGMVDVRDVVDSAVGALTTNAGAVAGRTFVLTGPRTIGFAEVADILSRVVGREIAYAPVPHEAAGEALLGMGLPEWDSRGLRGALGRVCERLRGHDDGERREARRSPTARLRAVRQRLQADLGVTVRRAVGRRERRHEELERAVNPRTARLNHMRNVHTTPIRRAR
jgi:uncharacterized protein YbjT (DUF2867 family)